MDSDALTHLLSLVTSKDGDYVAVHAGVAGITLLIKELQALKRQLELDDCPHAHLFTADWAGDVLTTTKLADQEDENNIVHHVKIYGWNKEWASRHGLKP
jgi:hypothetical protein